MWSNIPIVFLFKVFICLAPLGLSWGIFNLVLWPGIKLEFPALECRVLATGSSAKFCSLIFIYYSEFLVWVRKISPSFHDLAIYFKSFFFSMNFINPNWRDSVWNFIKFTYEFHPVRWELNSLSSSYPPRPYVTSHCPCLYFTSCPTLASSLTGICWFPPILHASFW